MQNTDNIFFSMDRLVEFGMGMAMSQQIVQSMNNMMESMRRMPQMQVVAQPLFVQQPIQPGVPVQPAYQAFAGQPPVPQVQAVQVGQAVPQVQAVQAGQQVQAGQSAAQKQPAESAPALPPPVPEAYYVAQNGAASGPFSVTELARLVTEKKLSASTYVWKTGMTEWKTAADFTELVALIALVPPAVVPASAQDIAKGSES